MKEERGKATLWIINASFQVAKAMTIFWQYGDEAGYR
jgi:hypothetical protein